LCDLMRRGPPGGTRDRHLADNGTSRLPATPLTLTDAIRGRVSRAGHADFCGRPASDTDRGVTARFDRPTSATNTAASSLGCLCPHKHGCPRLETSLGGSLSVPCAPRLLRTSVVSDRSTPVFGALVGVPGGWLTYEPLATSVRPPRSPMRPAPVVRQDGDQPRSPPNGVNQPAGPSWPAPPLTLSP
jgi:hypothetical protein